MRPWLPFLTGIAGGAGVIIGSVIAAQALTAITDRDWGYVVALVLAAACIGIGGMLVLISALEAT